jgi:hypothetical protein
MITNTGKNILAKYLIGQAPSYASYIAFGCGAKPKLSSDVFSPTEVEEYSLKESLDFEMFRSPIVSRGYVNEGGVSQIVFTAELPTEERYEITELGIYSAASNPSSGANDSRVLYSFSDAENWEYHTIDASVPLPFFQQRLSQSSYDEISNTWSVPEGESDSSINIDDSVFTANSDNVIFETENRIRRNERCRFLNNTVFIRGDACSVRKNIDGSLYYDTDPEAEGYDPNHIHLNGISLGLDKNSARDEIRLSYSIVNKNNDSENPTDVGVIVEFASSDTTITGNKEYARFKFSNSSGTLSTNRYFVESQRLEDLEYSDGFSWNTVTIVKIYSSISSNEDPYSDKFFLALDAIRFENTTTTNPLYGLTGYTVVKNDLALELGSQVPVPVIKEPNSANLVEFRFAMDVM